MCGWSSDELPPAPEPEPQEELPEPAVEVRKLRAIRGGLGSGRIGHQWSAKQDEEHASFIAGLLMRGYARAIIKEACGQKFGKEFTRGRFNEVWDKLARATSADFDAQKPHARAIQAQRLEAYLAQLIKEKKWASVTRVEALLADLYGTKQASRVDVTAHIAGNVVSVVASLSEEQLGTMLEKARQRKQLAAAAQAAGIPALPPPPETE